MPEPMTKTVEPVTIKKYANRRLYNTGTSSYVTLEDLAAMVKTGEDFVVYDAKTGEDITRSVLTQIIFEQENKEGQNLLPIAFLRQLIRFYGDSMQMLVPRYLEVSIDSLTREQEKFRHQISQAFGVGAFGSLEEQVRRNMEMFERTFAMFAPFARRESQGGGPNRVPRRPRPAISTTSSVSSTRCSEGSIAYRSETAKGKNSSSDRCQIGRNLKNSEILTSPLGNPAGRHGVCDPERKGCQVSSFGRGAADAGSPARRAG